MAKKATKKPTNRTALSTALDTAAKLRAENRALRAEVKKLNELAELYANSRPVNGDLVRVEVGPLPAAPRMPWDDALPNGFAEGDK